MTAAYLSKYGQAVLDNGYLIVPIVKGSKAPGLGHPAKKWSEMKADDARLQSWIDRGYGENGIGVLSSLTPGVDMDCQDESLIVALRAFVIDRLGPTIERVGLPPKTLLVYRADSAFPKVNSNVFIDGMGRTAKLEVLGDGQQFVALHVHPDTHKPYRWKDKAGVHNTPVTDLPVITRADAEAIRDEFERLARERGWPEKKTLSRLGHAGIDRDNPFIHDAPKVLDLNDTEIRGKLLLVPNADDYEVWLQIGMALFHQYDGGQFGLDLWHEWSGTASNYDDKALDAKWGSFDIEGKKRPPMTARLILKLAGKEEERLATEQLAECRQKIADCDDYPGLLEVAKEIKHLAFDRPTRHLLTVEVQKKYKVVTGAAATIAIARDLVRYEDPNRNADMPIWLKDTVYIEFEDVFYNWRRGESWPLNVFNNTNSRWMLSRAEVLEGKSQPETRPSDLALNVLTVPTVSKRMYMPALYDDLADPIFEIDGIRYINSYSPAGVPETPEIISPSGHLVIERVERHLEHLFRSPKDRSLLLDWIAYIVQTAQRVNWAPLIQGVSGDGKTWFGEMMKAVLGDGNVFILKGRALEEQYNGWAEGHQIVFIEEVRLHGKNRWDAVNNLKTNITNSVVEIRKMRTDTYNTINQTSYFITTNYRDSLPMDSSDTRYFPMFSRWQRKEEIDKFKEENPDYYVDLYAALHEPGVIRKWLMERELSEEFSATKRAPLSASRREMLDLSRTEESDAFETSLEMDASFDYCDAILDSSLCASKMTGHGASAPQTWGLNQMLLATGFSLLGKLFVEGKQRRLWTRQRERFTTEEGEPDRKAVAAYYAANDGKLDVTGL